MGQTASLSLMATYGSRPLLSQHTAPGSVSRDAMDSVASETFEAVRAVYSPAVSPGLRDRRCIRRQDAGRDCAPAFRFRAFPPAQQLPAETRMAAAKRLVTVQQSDAGWEVAGALLSAGDEPMARMWAANAMAIKAERDWDRVPSERRGPLQSAMWSALLASAADPAVSHALARAAAAAAVQTPSCVTALVGAAAGPVDRAAAGDESSLPAAAAALAALHRVPAAVGALSSRAETRRAAGAELAAAAPTLAASLERLLASPGSPASLLAGPGGGAAPAQASPQRTACCVAALDCAAEWADAAPALRLAPITGSHPGLARAIFAAASCRSVDILGAASRCLLSGLRGLQADVTGRSGSTPSPTTMPAAAAAVAALEASAALLLAVERSSDAPSRAAVVAVASVVSVVVERLGDVLCSAASDATGASAATALLACMTSPHPVAATAVEDAVAVVVTSAPASPAPWLPPFRAALTAACVTRARYDAAFDARRARGTAPLAGWSLESLPAWPAPAPPSLPPQIRPPARDGRASCPAGDVIDLYHARQASRSAAAEAAAADPACAAALLTEAAAALRAAAAPGAGWAAWCRAEAAASTAAACSQALTDALAEADCPAALAGAASPALAAAGAAVAPPVAHGAPPVALRAAASLVRALLPALEEATARPIRAATAAAPSDAARLAAAAAVPASPGAASLAASLLATLSLPAEPRHALESLAASSSAELGDEADDDDEGCGAVGATKALAAALRAIGSCPVVALGAVGADPSLPAALAAAAATAALTAPAPGGPAAPPAFVSDDVAHAAGALAGAAALAAAGRAGDAAGALAAAGRPALEAAAAAVAEAGADPARAAAAVGVARCWLAGVSAAVSRSRLVSDPRGATASLLAGSTTSGLLAVAVAAAASPSAGLSSAGLVLLIRLAEAAGAAIGVAAAGGGGGPGAGWLGVCASALTAHGSPDALVAAAAGVEAVGEALEAGAVTPRDAAAAVTAFLGKALPPLDTMTAEPGPEPGSLLPPLSALSRSPPMAVAAARLVDACLGVAAQPLAEAGALPACLGVGAACCRARCSASDRPARWVSATVTRLLGERAPMSPAAEAAVWAAVGAQAGPVIRAAVVSLADPAVRSAESGRASVAAVLLLAAGDTGVEALRSALAELAGMAAEHARRRGGAGMSAADAGSAAWGGAATPEGVGRIGGAVASLVAASGRQGAVVAARAAGAGLPAVPRGWARQVQGLLVTLGRVMRGEGTAEDIASMEASASPGSADVVVLE